MLNAAVEIAAWKCGLFAPPAVGRAYFLGPSVGFEPDDLGMSPSSLPDAGSTPVHGSVMLSPSELALAQGVSSHAVNSARPPVGPATSSVTTTTSGPPAPTAIYIAAGLAVAFFAASSLMSEPDSRD